MKNPKPLIVISIVLVIVLAILIYGYSQYKIYQEEYQGTESTQGEDVEVVIPEGAATKQIAQILKDNGLIQFPAAFVKRVKESEYRGVLQPGTFTLNTGMSTWEMIEILGQVEPTRTVKATVTIPEGFSIEQIAARMASEGICTQDEFLEAVQDDNYDYAFLDSIPDGITVNYRLQGFLFPATYDVYEDTTPHALVNMMLQMCPTVLYPITNGIYDKSEVTYDDLEIDSPYNTYKYTGLPVGPICNPGEVSMQAVLNPAEHNYLYYHVDNEETGSHIFTETYEQHLETQ